MGRWGHDRDDDTDGKPLTHLVRANQATQRVRLAPKPVREKPSETPSRSYVKPSATSVKDRIRELVLADHNLRGDELAKEIERTHGSKPSSVTVSMIRTEFRAALKFLDARGHLKGVTLKKGDGATKR